MSKNQPRYGNGKFAKMIRVEDKYGNSAYFTPEELEGFGKKKEEKNPDCEPATKGYVKCLLRKTWYHKHRLTGSGWLLLISVMFGWIFTIGFGSVLVSPSDFNLQVTTAQQWFPSTLLFSLATTVFLIEAVLLEVEGRKEEMPTEIQKYSHPVCEKKDECE